MTRKPLIAIFSILPGLYAPALAQDDCKTRTRAIFYNVENLFDPSNDSLKMDDDFTPEGAKRWGYKRYQAKLSAIYKTLIAASGGEPAGIIGLCEVENLQTLEDLTAGTPLKETDYEIIHQESADPRGIDVALLYQRDVFAPISTEFIAVRSSGPKEWTGREILYAKGVIFGTDTIHVFVNHWPARLGGAKESEGKRLRAAAALKQKTDSLFLHEINPRILIMGDMNDNPDDKSLRILQGGSPGLINMTAPLYRKGEGTLTYSGEFFRWFLFDQFIVSTALCEGPLKAGEARIFNPEWLCDPDSGKPFRTYSGNWYLGGFSDHFPVFMDIYSGGD